jgi:hypothetical protein
VKVWQGDIVQQCSAGRETQYSSTAIIEMMHRYIIARDVLLAVLGSVYSIVSKPRTVIPD